MDDAPDTAVELPGGATAAEVIRLDADAPAPDLAGGDHGPGYPSAPAADDALEDDEVAD